MDVYYDKLFGHLMDQHNLILLQTELDDTIRLSDYDDEYLWEYFFREHERSLSTVEIRSIKSIVRQMNQN